MKRSFRPPLWAWFAAGAALTLFLSLAAWQFQRGQGKERRLAQFQNDATPPVALTAATPTPPPLALHRARATGRYEERSLLQDGQSRGGRPGYHVWSPLRLADGGLLLVNRGWIPQPFDPAVSPLAVPEGEVTVTGWWRDLPRPGIRVAAGSCGPPASFPAVVVYPDREQLHCTLGEPVLPGLLLMDLREAGGFVREWSAAGLPPVRHYGYALTWFGLALVTVILFIVLNLKTKDDSPA